MPITGVARQKNSLSKGKIKRNIVELMVVNKKGGRTSNKSLDRPTLGLWDNEKVRGVSYDIFLLVIISTIDHFNVSQILIGGDDSCDIMCSELFEKVSLKKENL